MCRYFSYKIRFEAPKRQLGKERDKPKTLQRLFNYKSIYYWIEDFTTKAIAFVEKIDNMLERQIVVKRLGKQIDIEDPAYRKYAITDFHSIVWMLIAVIVTIYRTITLSEGYQISHYKVTTKLRSCI